MVASTALPDTCLLCHECALLVDLAHLEEGQRAVCPRCGYLLSARHRDANVRILAFALTALLCLGLSTGFDFVHLSSTGLERQLSLPQTITTLFSLREWSLAAFMGLVIIGLPLVFLGTLGALVLGIQANRAGHWSFTLLRCVGFLRFWNMAEIFFLGILVSMVKIADLAQVSLGLSFWAYACFNLFLILALANVDRHQLALAIRRQLAAREAAP